MIYLALTVLGLCFGSFVNALVYRLYEQSTQTKAKSKKLKVKKRKELSILYGRSLCPNCKHQLAARDLLPVVSWLFLHGKCRYCRKAISWQYPAVEIITALLFVLSYSFWPDKSFDAQNTMDLTIWLISLIGLTALVVYDLRWMLLPNKIVFPLLVLASVGVLVDTMLTSTLKPLFDSVMGMIIGGGLFYVLFQFSRGRWIGGGDVKLGFLLGLLLGAPALSLLMLFVASLLGSSISIPLLISKKVSPKTRIPFGPFLIMAAIVVQLWGEGIIGWYVETLIRS